MAELDILKGETIVLRANWQAAEQRAAEWRELAQQLRKIEKRVGEMRLTGRAPIGPLYGVGWDTAISAVLKLFEKVPNDRT